MALTATVSTKHAIGDAYVNTGTLAFDASYPTGGEVFDWRLFGFQTGDYLRVESDGTYIFVVDYTNKKVLAYSGLGTQVTNATDLSALTAVRWMGIGV